MGHDRGADGQHDVDDDEFSAVEGEGGPEAAHGGVGEGREDKDEDDVEEHGDGGDEGAVPPDLLEVEDPEGVEREKNGSREEPAPDAYARPTEVGALGSNARAQAEFLCHRNS